MGTIITPKKKDIVEEEIDFKSGVSERTWFKIGSAINFINIKHAEQHTWNLNGSYGAVASNGIDGVFICPFAMEIVAVAMSNMVKGASGTTTIDIHWFKTNNADQGTIFGTRPAISSAAPDVAWLIKNFLTSFSKSGTGITIPTLAKSTFAEGEALRWDIDTAMVGARDLSTKIYFRPI